MTDREAFEAWAESPRGSYIDAWGAYQAALASERAKPNEWKEAVIEKLVVSHILQESHEFDPHGAINDLLAWETQIALDPQVSCQAQALIDRGAASERAKPAEPLSMSMFATKADYDAALAQQAEPVANLHDNKTAVTEPHPMLSATG